jgi:carbon monoxide dehydrogenase subunit G
MRIACTRCYLFFTLLFSIHLAQAGTIRTTTVERHGDFYALAISVQIDAPIEVVYQSITDFDNLAAINPNIENSHLVGWTNAETQRVHSVIKVCILMFCKRIVQVQDVTRPGEHVIEAVIVPSVSDFRSGFARWQLRPQGESTLLSFSHRFEPDFWVPPVIGPWIIKRKLISEVAETAMYIETGVDGQGQ